MKDHNPTHIVRELLSQENEESIPEHWHNKHWPTTTHDISD